MTVFKDSFFDVLLVPSSRNLETFLKKGSELNKMPEHTLMYEGNNDERL